MRLNVAELAKTDALMTEELSIKVIEEIKVLDIEKYEISFAGVRLISLNFLTPFIKYIDSVVGEDVTVRFIETEHVPTELILEAYKNCLDSKRNKHEKL